ncbi:short-chain dehydrogenase, partial [Pseudomonas sp. MWU12-2534b]
QPGDDAQAIAVLVGNGCATSIVVECDGGLRLV